MLWGCLSSKTSRASHDISPALSQKSLPPREGQAINQAGVFRQHHTRSKSTERLGPVGLAWSPWAVPGPWLGQPRGSRILRAMGIRMVKKRH